MINTIDLILAWWLKKYTPQIINYINMVIQFEELTAEDLDIKRRALLLEYLDTSDSAFVSYLVIHVPDFLDTLYTSIYSQSMIVDSPEELDKLQI